MKTCFSPSPRNLLLLALTSFLAAATGLSAQFDIHASSYLGGSDNSSRVAGSVILSDGTIVLATNLAFAQPAAPVTTTIGLGSNGAIVRLSADGRSILSVTHLSEVVHDLSSDQYDNLYVAAGTFGLMKLNPTADEVLWTRLAGSMVWRVDAGDDGHCAVVVTDGNTRDNNPGAGTVHLFAPNGDPLTSFGVGGNLLDVAVDSRTQTLIFTGWYNFFTYNGPYSRGYNGRIDTPVDVPFTTGVPFNYGQPGVPMKWRLHGWSRDVWLDKDARIPNPRWINYPFSTAPSNLYTQEEIDAREAAEGTVTGWYQYLLGMPKTFNNNMADTRSYRVTVGQDGKLYIGSEPDGGNTPLRYSSQDLGVSAPWTITDGTFDLFANTSTVPKISVSVYELHDDSVTWLRTLGFTNRRSSSGTTDNTIHMRGGALDADETGRVYITGRSFFGFYLPNNTFPNFSIPRAGEVAFDPFQDDDPFYTGGAYLLVYSPDFRTRLYSTRVAGGQGRALAVRTLDTQQTANFVWGGWTGPNPNPVVNRVHLVNPVQSSRLGPDDGTNGWFAFVQGEDAQVRALIDADEVNDPASPVVLDGSRSFSLEGYLTSWTWRDLDTDRILSHQATASLNLPEGAYNISLTVTDSLGLSDTSQTRIYVTSGSPTLLPRFETSPPSIAVKDWPFSYTATVSTGSASTFVSVSGAPAGLVLTDNGDGSATLAGAATASGTYRVTLLVEANGVTKEQSWVLTVYDGGVGGVLLDDPFIDYPAEWNFVSDSNAAGKPTFRYLNSGRRLTTLSTIGSRGFHQQAVSTQSVAHYYSFPFRENITDATLSTTGIHRPGNDHAIVRALVGYDDGSGLQWAVSNEGIHTTSGGWTAVTPVPGAWNMGNFTWSSVNLDNLNGGVGAGLSSALVLENARAIGVAHVGLTASWQAESQAEISSLTLVSHRETLPDKPAVFTSVPPTAAVIDELYSYAIALDDPADLPVAVTFAGSAPGWLSLSENGGVHILSGTPDEADAGMNWVTLVATNSAGAQSWQSFAISVVASEAPVFTVLPPSSVYVGGHYNHPVRAVSSIDSSLLQLTVLDLPAWLDFYDFGNGFGQFAGTAPEAEGSYALTLVASDGVRETTHAFTLEVEEMPPNILPTAALLPSITDGFAPLEVFFDGNLSSDPDGVITAYDWSFGEGSTASGPVVSFIFTEPGKYTVQLTVTDDRGGTDSTTVDISVRVPGSLGPTLIWDDFATNTVSQWNTRGFDQAGRASNFTWSASGQNNLDTTGLDEPGVLRVVPSHNGDNHFHMHKVWKNFDRGSLSGAMVFSDGLYANLNNLSNVNGFLIGYEVDGETRWAITSTNVIQRITGGGVVAARRSWALNNFNWRALDWDNPFTGRGDPVLTADVLGNAVSFGVYSRIEGTWLNQSGLQMPSLELYAPHEAFPEVTSAPFTGVVPAGGEFSHMLSATCPNGYGVTWDVVDPLPAWLTLENLGGGMAQLVGTPPAGTSEDLLIRLQASTDEVGPAYYTFLLQIDDTDAPFDPHPPFYNMSLTQVPGGLRMEWFGYPGIQYQLQVSDDLQNWSDLGPMRPGASEMMSHEETLSVGQPRFFRINYTYGW
ncbi:MAG: PKD domain-containing protein [Opitutales bacterium]|nr:PKD domain-containing protein [Opitutales bacterium]